MRLCMFSTEYSVITCVAWENMQLEVEANFSRHRLSGRCMLSAIRSIQHAVCHHCENPKAGENVNGNEVDTNLRIMYVMSRVSIA